MPTTMGTGATAWIASAKTSASVAPPTSLPCQHCPTLVDRCHGSKFSRMFTTWLESITIRWNIHPRIPIRQPARGRHMTGTPVDIVRRVLSDPAVVKELVAEDSVYVSLNYQDEDLKKIMPWAGTG